MPEEIPTVYTEPGPTSETRLATIRVPTDIADELTLVTLWLSLQLNHEIPLEILRRAVLLNGLHNARRVLATLRDQPR